MKYALVIPDGCADEPQDSLDGRTPLQAASIPHMDHVAATGVVGTSNNVPLHLTAGSAVANMSLLGYDVNQFFSGRAPMEAAAQKIKLEPLDWALRCNLVTIEDQTMVDFTADHISSEEATALLNDLQAAIGDTSCELVPGVSYRNLLIHRAGQGNDPPYSKHTTATPPHDLTDKSVVDDYPRGPGSDLLMRWMSASVDVFDGHPVNERRVSEGKKPATNVWLWGFGQTPQLPLFQERFGIQGAMITAVDLLRGLAQLIGWPVIEVPGATGYTDTDYAAKGRYAIAALEEHDFVCVHVEASDEASHEGDAAAKIKALEEIDQHIVGPVHEALRSHGDYRIAVSPDHPTLLSTKTHSHGLVPWAICGKGIEADSATTYDESSAADSQLCWEEGHQFMPYFLNGPS